MGRSKWLLFYLIIAHGLMLAMIMTLLPNVWLSLLVAIIISASFIYYCQRHQWLKSNRAIIRAERDTKGRWQLFHSDNTSKGKLSLKQCVVTSKLVILYLSGASFWESRAIIIIADATDPELFRQLRVYLRDPKTFPQ